MSNSKTLQESLKSRLQNDLPKKAAKKYPYNPYKWYFKYKKEIEYLTGTTGKKNVLKKRNAVRIMAQKEIDLEAKRC